MAPVKVAVVQDDGCRAFSRFRVGDGGFHFFEDPASHVVVVAGDGGHRAVLRRAGEANGTVERVVFRRPDAGSGPDFRLVAVSVIGGDKRLFPGGEGRVGNGLLNTCVLVEFVGRVSEFLLYFPRCLAVAYVVIVIGVSVRAEGGRGKLASPVVAKNCQMLFSATTCGLPGTPANHSSHTENKIKALLNQS